MLRPAKYISKTKRAISIFKIYPIPILQYLLTQSSIYHFTCKGKIPRGLVPDKQLSSHHIS